MKPIFSTILKQNLKYDGTELRSGWIESVTGFAGDAAVAFVGPANVPVENMVDLEDVAANAPIFSESMLHFLIEMRGADLEKMVLRQRLLIALLKEELEKSPSVPKLRRDGDDLYDGDGHKLTVSIATLSSVSALIHTGINIVSRNTPVPTKGLEDYGIEPKTLAQSILDRFGTELKEIVHATKKVRKVL